jgi:hypothetical protein
VEKTRFLEHVLMTLPYRVEAVMIDNDMMFTMRSALDAIDAIRAGTPQCGH